MADGQTSLAEFFAGTEPPPAPLNLGNIPPEPTEQQAETPEEQAPVEEPAPEPAAPVEEPAAEPEAPQAADGDTRLADLERRLAEQDRLITFLQAGSRPAPEKPAPPNPVELIRQRLGGLEFSEQDVTTLIQDPARGREFLNNAMMAAAAAGASLAIEQSRVERQAENQQRDTTTQLRDVFYARHADLVPFADLVRMKAEVVHARRNGAPVRDIAGFADETAREVRAQLTQWGVTPKPAAAAPVRPGRRAPRGEMGGRGRGAISVAPKQRELDSFIAATLRH